MSSRTDLNRWKADNPHTSNSSCSNKSHRQCHRTTLLQSNNFSNSRSLHKKSFTQAEFYCLQFCSQQGMFLSLFPRIAQDIPRRIVLVRNCKNLRSCPVFHHTFMDHSNCYSSLGQWFLRSPLWQPSSPCLLRTTYRKSHRHLIHLD
jgi:hypothetical protein